MKYLSSAIGILIASVLISPSLKAAEPMHHDIKVVLYPDEHRMTVQDRVTVPDGLLQDLKFLLHKGLKPSSTNPAVRIVGQNEKSRSVPAESFNVSLPAGQKAFVLEYGGSIHHPLEPYGKEQARGFRQTPGVVSAEGVYLSGSSLWYPTFDQGLVTFTLEVELPSGWDAVCQGKRTRHVREEDRTVVQWASAKPHEDIHIVAGPFTEYIQPAGKIDAMVFLRAPDKGLANKYLDATAMYLEMYEKLIGPYPYEKFALVENFWETGYGMASFTLLGPKIIRFPFILHSSYPHEILHNWWGNSVFPDYAAGNWAEGLTAYLSDHLIKETRGSGVAHRQENLQKYADYVSEERDFPLTQFRSRHSTSSEAVGYGKSLMFFHMLRQQLGDKLFVQGLQDFYKRNEFQIASFDDICRSFEDVSGKEMEASFDQWLTQPGAPELKVSRARALPEGGGYVLRAVLEQVQPEGEYTLRVPVAATMKGQSQTYQSVVIMDTRRLELSLHVPAMPLRLDVDPEYDLFRKLDRDETPPALTQAFGAKKMLILLPSSAGQGLLDAYRDLSQSLSQSGPDAVEVKLDAELKEVPSDRAVTLLGWENRFLNNIVSALSEYDVTINKKEIQIGPTKIKQENHSVVLTARQPKNKDFSLTWVATDVPEALSGLGRKLPHYHKYSYLGFQGAAPDNVVKGRWPVLDSPMTVLVRREDGTVSRVDRGELAPRKPLATLPPVFSKERMMETVRLLSNEKFQGRGFGTQGLDQTAEFIAQRFQEAGLRPAGDSEESYFQTWVDVGGAPSRKANTKNVIGVIPGKNPKLNAQSVVIGAHFDHLGLGWPDVREEHRGKIHPGADDNASGVAVLIELARVLTESLNPERNVVFAAFTGEEAGRRGSKYYVAKRNGYPPAQCIGMLNLDTVGRLGNRKLLVLGAGSAKEWIHIFRGAGFVTGVDIQAVSEELDSSDQKSFQVAGIPAVQLFSGPHLDYHHPTDTVDKIDADGLLKVAAVAKEVIEYLASREEPMTNTLEPGRKVDPTPKKGRNVSLGTIPDFTHTGDGCRLSGVVPDSPAERCGLMEGDVIVSIGSDPIHTLRDLSDILKSLHPGDKAIIKFLREGKEMSVETEVVKR
jgi:hypothetical protein